MANHDGLENEVLKALIGDLWAAIEDGVSTADFFKLRTRVRACWATIPIKHWPASVKKTFGTATLNER